MKSLMDKLKLTEFERNLREEEERQAQNDDRAMMIAVAMTVVLGLIIAGVTIAALVEVLTWTK